MVPPFPNTDARHTPCIPVFPLDRTRPESCLSRVTAIGVGAPGERRVDARVDYNP